VGSDVTPVTNAAGDTVAYVANNPAARFDRAIAYYKSDQLDAARADFLTLQAAHTNSFQIAYGLAEVCWRQQQTNEAIRNYRIYLANAPTTPPKFRTPGST